MSERRNKWCKFTIAIEEKIIKEYQNGKSLSTIGKQYSCDATTVKNILKAYNVPTRNLSQARRNYLNYEIDENAFSDIDNSNTAYWLGVMYSDGYISKTGPYTNYFGLTVSNKDIEWLQQFKTFLNYNGSIKEYTSDTSYKENTSYARLLIGNNKIVSDLEKWGVLERKTKLLKSLPKTSYLDDFIRGYIDGDGSLLRQYPHITISGNKEFLLAIADYFDIPYKLYQDKKIYSLQYNKKQSEYLEKRLYKNAKYSLKRKYDLAKRSFDSPVTLEEVM